MDVNEQLAWLNDLANDDSYHAESVKNDFALSLHRKMTRAQINQKSLAEKLSSTPAHISKVLRGDANLTIETMAKFARALDCHMHIHLAPDNQKVSWMPVIARTTQANSSAAAQKNQSINSSKTKTGDITFFQKRQNRESLGTLNRAANGN